jgi:hypothetical protein
MRTISRVTFVLLVSAGFANCCWGQRGVPAPRLAPTPRPGPVHPVVPHSGGPHSGGQGGSDSRVTPWVVIGGVVAVVGAAVGLVFGVRAWRNRTVAHLRILGTPPGEAPEEIRRAWVGIELPLRHGETEPSRLPTLGVLSEQGPEMTTGYAVDGRAAVAALASRSPEAAAWWRENAPHVVASGYRLFFPPEVCERVG